MDVPFWPAIRLFVFGDPAAAVRLLHSFLSDPTQLRIV
jgi:hypothetical protein